MKFGNVDVGSTSPTKTITLKNTSQADEYFALDVGGFQSTGVYQDTSKCDGPIAPGKTYPVTVSLTPNLGGSQVGVLTFTVLDAGGDVVPGASTEIPADIAGTAPNFTVSPTTVRFGNVNIGDSPFKEVEVKNTSKSDQDVRINSDSLPPGFILDAGSSRCDIGIPRTLEPGASLPALRALHPANHRSRDRLPLRRPARRCRLSDPRDPQGHHHHRHGPPRRHLTQSSQASIPQTTSRGTEMRHSHPNGMTRRIARTSLLMASLCVSGLMIGQASTADAASAYSISPTTLGFNDVTVGADKVAFVTVTNKTDPGV